MWFCWGKLRWVCDHFSDQREDAGDDYWRDRYTSHEVTAPRVVSLSGRTKGVPPRGRIGLSYYFQSHTEEWMLQIRHIKGLIAKFVKGKGLGTFACWFVFIVCIDFTGLG